MTQSPRPDVDSRGTQPTPLFASIDREPGQLTDYIPISGQIQPGLWHGAASRDLPDAACGLTAKSVFLNTKLARGEAISNAQSALIDQSSRAATDGSDRLGH